MCPDRDLLAEHAVRVVGERGDSHGGRWADFVRPAPTD